LLLAISLGPVACAERELDDGMADEPPEHPPELLERYDQACEDWCALLDECGRDEILCDCTARDFSERHDLCVEKAALRLECVAALTCDEIDLTQSDSVQDRLCFGEGIAEAGACNFD
jgi:hypothetical protein